LNKKILFVLVCSLFIFINKNYAQYQEISNSGLDIYYRVFGKGNPVLIIGGGPGDNSNRYLSLCNLLSNDFQCVLVDQRGTGKSVPEIYDSTTISISLTLMDFEVLREHLGLKNWIVLGFSYGGYLASLYANYYPASISQLILLESIGLNTDVFGYFLDNINSRLLSSDHELFDYWNDSVRVAVNPHHSLVERIRARMPGYFYDRKKSLIISQEINDSDFNFEVGHWIWKDVVKNELDLDKVKSNFNKPVLILHGRQDPVGESVPQILSHYYKNSTLVFIEKAGHYSWIEQPEVVINSIKKFMSGK